MSPAALPGSTPWPGRPGAPSTLRQCLTLAVLLHVLVVLVFGNTEGGSAAPGQGVARGCRIASTAPSFLRALDDGKSFGIYFQSRLNDALFE